MVLIRSLPLIALALLSACATTPQATPTSVATRFCTSTQKQDDTATIALTTPSLRAAIQTAMKENDRLIQLNPTDKPPLGDGIPWQAYPDYAPVCQPGKLTTNATGAYMEIHHIFTDTQNAPSSWIDKLLLVHTPSGWQIDDVLFPPNSGHGLRHSLKQAFAPQP